MGREAGREGNRERERREGRASNLHLPHRTRQHSSGLLPSRPSFLCPSSSYLPSLLCSARSVPPNALSEQEHSPSLNR